jgi:hypothetical protein
MAILGGSPLGIIGSKSVPSSVAPGKPDSGFNGGNSRNVVVSSYNRSQGGSLFTGRRRLRAWPNISKSVSSYPVGGTSVQDTTGISDVLIDSKTGKLNDKFQSSIGEDSKGSNLLHNNDVYDTSILNILEKLAPTKAALRPTDFAYLKNVGVYPNNRLMIARRFVAPSGDNIMVKRDSKEVASIATLISWRGEGDDFVEITFGEEWTSAKADFTGMLNSLGDDFTKSNLGGIAGAGANALPLPGFTEIFQRKFLESLGLLESGASNQIPSGNPNLIKEAKMRKTVPYGSDGYGLTAKVSIKMTCEYELKFISGIDPTMVWMDLIGMIVRFGTSESSNYGLSQAVAAKMGRWAANPYTLIQDVISGIKDAIKRAETELREAISSIYNAATEAASKLSSLAPGATASEPEAPGKSPKDLGNEAAAVAKDAGNALIDKLVSIGEDTIKASVMKYRVEVMGIVNALTGNPSTPWHITIGNPMRPVFCSGDMLTTAVTLKLGPILAFNDLPSSITVDFTLDNARNWGMQEIMAKFNSGYLRTVDVQKTFFETNASTSGTEPPGVLPGEYLTPNDSKPAVVGSTGSGVVNQGGNPLSASASNATVAISATTSNASATISSTASNATTSIPISGTPSTSVVSSPVPVNPDQSPVPGATINTPVVPAGGNPSMPGVEIDFTDVAAEQSKLEGGAKK